MSASSKKKLRNDQAADKLTEKQLAEQKQDKEVRFYTIGFVAVVAIVLIVAIFVGGQQIIANSGMKERSTIAYTVNDRELSNAELSYFFADTVNNFSQQYGPYAALMNLDVTKPLDQQYKDEEQTTTWADHFMEAAKDSAKSVYVLYDAAKAAGHTLSEDEQAQLNAVASNLELYASLSGAGSVKNYLKAVYGPGATEEGYRAYLEASITADSYRNAYAQSLKYEDADLREAEKENYGAYSSYTYDQYYLDASKFLKGGTEDAEGSKTYSQEEKDAAAKEAKAAADSLLTAKNAEELNAAIAALDVNKDTAAFTTPYVNNDYRNLSADAAQWLADPARKAGDTTVIESVIPSLDAEGNEISTVSGYTVLMFQSSNPNTEILPNVRHILVSFEGGTQDENGMTTYSDEEKAAAKEKAEALLKQYNEGEQTEEAFAALATENTMDPGSKENGGLYENVYRGQMVPSFDSWVFDESRKAGDVDIVETEYGFHVMYYCGEGTLSYRDLQLTSELTSKDLQAWYEDLMSAAVTVDGDTSRIRTDLVLNGGM